MLVALVQMTFYSVATQDNKPNHNRHWAILPSAWLWKATQGDF